MKSINIIYDNKQSLTSQDIHYSQLDNVTNASCNHINIGHTLDYLPVQYRIPILKKILSKLKYNGFVEILGTDIMIVSRQIYYGDLISEEICNTLYSGKQSVDSLINFVALLEQFGLNVIIKQSDNLYYYIKAQRNE